MTGSRPGIRDVIGQAVIWGQADSLKNEGLSQPGGGSCPGLDEVVIHPCVVVSVARGAEVDTQGLWVSMQCAIADVCQGCIQGETHALAAVSSSSCTHLE